MNFSNSGVGNEDNADFFGKGDRPYEFRDLHDRRFRERAELL